MNQIENAILIMKMILALLGNLLHVFCSRSLSVFLTLQKFAVRLSRYETLNKFIFGEASITIAIHPADY